MANKIRITWCHAKNTWKDGEVTNYRIASPVPSEVKVRVNGELKTIKSEKN